jgi:hypothetical protein
METNFWPKEITFVYVLYYIASTREVADAQLPISSSTRMAFIIKKLLIGNKGDLNHQCT